MDILIILLISIFGTIVLNRVLLVFAKNLGTRGAENIQVRWASTSKPSLGGFAFYLIFLGVFGAAGLLEYEYLIFSKRQLLGVFVATSCGFMIGFADDTYNTNPRLKAMGQLFCAFILYIFDIQIGLFDNTELLNFIFTTVWVVGLMNSINMLDNMDGVTASVSLSVLVCLVMILLIRLEVDYNIVLILTGVLGSLLGFLYHNWHPSKMYMGDAGSQFLGILLAIFTIPLLWNNNSFSLSTFHLSKLVFPILVFCIPFIDTITVIFYRIKRGSSPFLGGSDHTTHHLVRCGFSERQVVLLFFIINAIGILNIYLFLISDNPSRMFIFGLFIYILFIFLVLEYYYIKGKVQNRPKLHNHPPRKSLYDLIMGKW